MDDLHGQTLRLCDRGHRGLSDRVVGRPGAEPSADSAEKRALSGHQHLQPAGHRSGADFVRPVLELRPPPGGGRDADAVHIRLSECRRSMVRQPAMPSFVPTQA